MLTQEILNHISPVIAGKKYVLPLPTLSPIERQRTRTIRRNERYLHRRVCDFSARKILSTYDEHVPFPVYHKDMRRSDKWDPLIYGQDVDLGRCFFEQWYSLFCRVPKPNLSADVVENCEWVNMLGYSKDCYLTFSGDFCESCLYCTNIDNSEYCMDCTMVYRSQWCYACFNIHDCYNCLWSQYLRSCRDSIYCTDCRGCENCIGCVGLYNASYHIFNKQVTKEVFEEKQGKLSELDMTPYNDLLIKHTIAYNQQSENVSGAHIDSSFDCHACYNLVSSRNCLYVERGYDSEDCYDAYGSFSCHKSYNISSVGVKGYGCYCTMYCWWDVTNLLYCDHCFSCKDCFGCIGLRNKKYCIFNKQYTKEVYERLVGEIIDRMITNGERGKFFPTEFSPFSYNETKAYELFPLTNDEVIKRGRKRHGFENSKGQTDAIYCKESGRYFRYQPKELELYKKRGIEPPTLHPQVRYQNRLQYDVVRNFS